MKGYPYLIAFFATALSVAVVAQQTPSAPEPIVPPVPPVAPVAPVADLEAAQRQLEDAQRRLEKAAREVAEYSTQLHSEHMPQVHKIRIHSGGNGKGAMLGVHIDGASDKQGNRIDGVEVVGVTPNGPAEQAGLEDGDRIVALNGENLQWQDDQSPVEQLLGIMADVEPENSVTVDYVRDGEANSVIVETEQLGDHRIIGNLENFDFDFDFDFDISEHQGVLKDKIVILNDEIKGLYNRFQRPWHDLELMEISPKLGSYFNTDEGVLVISTGDNDELNLEDGDVILNIDGRELKDPAHTMRILGSYSAGETVTLEIMRERRKKTIEFKVKDFNEDVSFRWIENIENSPGVRNFHWDSNSDDEVKIIRFDEGQDVTRIKLEKQDSI